MKTHTLTYPGNVEHIVGQKFVSPFFKKSGDADLVSWVATDAVYDPDTNVTKVEMDLLSKPNENVHGIEATQ